MRKNELLTGKKYTNGLSHFCYVSRHKSMKENISEMFHWFPKEKRDSFRLMKSE